MILGVRAHDYSSTNISTLLSTIYKDGWQGIQLAIKKSIPQVKELTAASPELLAEISASLQTSGLHLSVLGAYEELGITDTVLRKKALREFEAGIRIAKQLGAHCLGTETTSFSTQPGVTQQEAMRALKSSLEQVLPLAQELGVIVAVEPVYGHTMGTPELTREILQDMASKNLAVILDPVNLLDDNAIGSNEAQLALWHRAFECFGSHIAAVHVKGAVQQGGRLVSNGISLSDSTVDFTGVFRLLKQNPAPLHILREQAVPAYAAEDIRRISEWYQTA